MLCLYRDPANVNENVSDVTAFDPIEMRIGYFHDTQLDGNVACMPIGPN